MTLHAWLTARELEPLRKHLAGRHDQLALVMVLLVVIVTQDSQRRQAVEAKEAATAEVQVLRLQQRCSNTVQAKSDAALLALVVALYSGEGGVEAARVDAQAKMQQWLDAAEQCSTG